MIPEAQLEKPRPSSLARMLACPGSRRLAMLAPPKPSSVWADEGTAAHHIGEQCLSMGRAPFEFFGQKVTVHAVDYRVDADMVVAVSKYVHHVYQDRHQLSRSARMYIEKKIWLDEINNGGMVDCLIVDPEQCAVHVHDYKHGKGVYVSEVWNAQFLAYGVAGARAMLPGVPLDDISFRFVVHQPRFSGVAPSRGQDLSGPAVKSWVQDTLIPRLAAARHPDAKLHSGPHCQFCPAKTICVEYLSAPRKPFGHVPIEAAPAELPPDFTF